MLTTFLTIALSIFIAELGDKTQLLVVGFAAKYKLRDIFIGVTGALILLNALGVFLGALLSELIPIDYIKFIAGFFFLVFAILSLKTDDKEEKAELPSKMRFGAMTGIGIAFFVAELGDKTQLSAIAFAAQKPTQLIAVFLGAMLGMLLADGVGLAVGLVLNKKLPERAFAIAAFLIFSVFGLTTLWESINKFAPSFAIPILAIIVILYSILTLLVFKRKKQ